MVTIHTYNLVNLKKQPRRMTKRDQDKLMNRETQIVSLVALSCFALYCTMMAILAIWKSAYYAGVKYFTMTCAVEIYGIAFFMGGKLSMYFLYAPYKGGNYAPFNNLRTIKNSIHSCFKESVYAIPVKWLLFVTGLFFGGMAIIGAFYMYFLYVDLSNLGTISTPKQCQLMKVSSNTSTIILIGASFDSGWSLSCWFLFLLQLARLTVTYLFTT
ncbi:hypothetical protein RFI_25197 [Reticulomyxa filosa]|uniref:Uncharacterized protein n=1 Tax=Reticulomyxa filosa TaxID=46433 RepID=X6MFH9_RETFI|nr:hypothetical protein RFI_25197 [Reticulomyxa filosa]|eukprot:ETO12182.1 hypothetical protein RFI_25197 [Reticulomyxa filosa]